LVPISELNRVLLKTTFRTLSRQLSVANGTVKLVGKSALRKEKMNDLSSNPTSQDLALRLLAYESAPSDSSTLPAGFRVCERLRPVLSTLTGTLGYRSLLMRALTLARRESSVLRSVEVNAEGSLESLNGDAGEDSELLVIRLISLLAAFIGEPLTVRLLQDVWPDLAGSNSNQRDNHQ